MEHCIFSKKSITTFFWCQWSLLLIQTVFSYFYIGYVFDLLIARELIIHPSSFLFEYWKAPPIAPVLKITLFNISNPNEYYQGAKLKVKEIGPFVYQENWKRVNVTFETLDFVSFDNIRSYQFLPEVSKSLEESLLLPNVPLAAAKALLTNEDSLSQWGLFTSLDLLGIKENDIFIQKSAQEFIWGYTDPLMKLSSYILSSEDIKGDPNKFGFFNGKNGSSEGRFTINTGYSNLEKHSEVLSWKGHENLLIWNTKECNRIHGNDGGQFHSFIKKNEILSIFVPDICRSLDFEFLNESSSQNISTLRYVPSSINFNNELFENDCYCVNSSIAQERRTKDFSSESYSFNADIFSSLPSCRREKKGVFDLGPCQSGIPLVLSWPHFYDADPSYGESLEGLSPDETKHRFYLDVQPKLGLCLSAKIRLQINLKMKSKLLPLLWFEQEIGNFTHEILELISQSIELSESLSRIVFLCNLCLLSSQIFIYVICVLVSRTKKKSSETSLGFITTKL